MAFSASQGYLELYDVSKISPNLPITLVCIKLQSLNAGKVKMFEHFNQVFSGTPCI